MNALQGKEAGHEQQHGYASSDIQRSDRMDTVQREQRVVAGDTQPQERETPGNWSQYSGCTLSDRLTHPGLQTRTEEGEKDAGAEGDGQKIDGEGRQDGFPDGCRPGNRITR